MLDRVRFYCGTFALREALFGVENDEPEANRDGMAEYVYRALRSRAGDVGDCGSVANVLHCVQYIEASRSGMPAVRAARSAAVIRLDATGGAMTFAAIYAIVVGVGMIGQWSASLYSRRVPELVTEPFRIGFHLAAEGLTAIALIAGGWAALAGAPWARQAYLVAMGMLLYTSVVSPGYFAQCREWPMVGMFAAILLLALISIGLVW
ncbi:MAG: hypothetical protein JXA09_03465 [Anaerolineae bacterium]|nr:hypothetical protein [Anaerolineae bacterium]